MRGYVEKLIGNGISFMSVISSIISKVLPSTRETLKEEGCSQMQEAMHILMCGPPEQVAYYQEHYEKFVNA